MKYKKTKIDGPVVIYPDVYGDERGFFVESFQTEKYADILGGKYEFVQDNISHSQKGVLRGLHFQTEPYAQGKLVSVLSGSVFDVAVDIRPGSKTFGEYVSVTLNAPTRDKKGVWRWTQFWIPPGFAHGFLSLEDDTLFVYKCTNFYAPKADAGLMWNDETIAIEWPNIETDFIISPKDKEHKNLIDLNNE